MASVDERLLQFTATYVAVIERLLDERGRKAFPFHSDRIASAVIVRASDALATFYLPAGPWPGTEEACAGISWRNHREHTLNEVVQSYHASALRIQSVPVGTQLKGPGRPAPATGPIAGVKDCFLHPDLARLDSPAEGWRFLTVAEPFRHEHGVVTGLGSVRRCFWAPIADVPHFGLRRPFRWTHADFWWFPERLRLDPHKAATSNFHMLESGERHRIQSSAFFAETGPLLGAAAMLDARCDEFLRFLDQSGNDELAIHAWLERPENLDFLDPGAEQVWSKLEFTSAVEKLNKGTDFIVRRSDGTYVVIEIERATKLIINPGKEAPSADFRHAAQQVSDWITFIRKNWDYVQRELKLDGIYEPMGRVIMGRSSDIAGEAARIRWDQLKAGDGCPHEVLTYDDLISRVRAQAEQLRKKAAAIPYRG